jgi:hypothetical protein
MGVIYSEMVLFHPRLHYYVSGTHLQEAENRKNHEKAKFWGKLTICFSTKKVVIHRIIYSIYLLVFPDQGKLSSNSQQLIPKNVSLPQITANAKRYPCF